MNKDKKHYTIGEFTPHAKWLEDDEYAKILDNVVIACTDILITNKSGDILLGNRQNEPNTGWWIMGGRMKPGESFEDAAKRNINRELGLDIAKNRFKHFDCYFSSLHGSRAQEPKENGSQTISIVLSLEITNEEFMKIKHNKEYSELKWFEPNVIFIENFKGAVKQCVGDFMDSNK